MPAIDITRNMNIARRMNDALPSFLSSLLGVSGSDRDRAQALAQSILPSPAAVRFVPTGPQAPFLAAARAGRIPNRFFGDFVDDVKGVLGFISGIRDPKTKNLVIDQLFAKGGRGGMAPNLGASREAMRSLLKAFPDTTRIVPKSIGPSSTLAGRDQLQEFLDRIVRQFNR